MTCTQGGFAAGDAIRINPDGDNEEDNQVKAIGSVILAEPLKFAHEAGEPVVELTPTGPSGFGITGGFPPAVEAVGGLSVLLSSLGAAVTMAGGTSLFWRSRRRTPDAVAGNRVDVPQRERKSVRGLLLALSILGALAVAFALIAPSRSSRKRR